MHIEWWRQMPTMWLSRVQMTVWPFIEDMRWPPGYGVREGSVLLLFRVYVPGRSIIHGRNSFSPGFMVLPFPAWVSTWGWPCFWLLPSLLGCLLSLWPMPHCLSLWLYDKSCCVVEPALLSFFTACSGMNCGLGLSSSTKISSVGCRRGAGILATLSPWASWLERSSNCAVL